MGTRLAFLAAGFASASWAPLVPFAKTRLGLTEAGLGLLLLCLGTGSALAMPIVGSLSTRIGSKPIITWCGLTLAASLPLLGTLSSRPAMAIALLLFGGSLGGLDVAMNLHAVHVERLAGRPLLSGFHALFSLGGFAGSGLMTLMLSRRFTPLTGTLCASAAIAVAIVTSLPALLETRSEEEAPLFAVPRGAVLLVAFLTAMAFLVEGAMLDWGALLLVARQLLSATRSGLGYMLFTVAMTCGRLTGDRVVARLGERRVLRLGSSLAFAGLVLLSVSRSLPLSLAGFVLIGFGAANVVPILFRRAGNEQGMHPGLALAAVTTAGYAGLLTGPPFIGFIARITSLPTSFLVLAAMTLPIALFSTRALNTSGGVTK